MKTPRIVNAVSHIDDDLINDAMDTKASKKSILLKWGTVAACLAVILMAGSVVAPMMFDSEDPIPPIDNEHIYEKGYVYNIDDGDFSTYFGGKVISEEKVGSKIEGVTITAGWKNKEGEWVSETEKLRGEVYSINGIANDVAVALKFIDEGESITTTHYYVIMNSSGDLTPVREYIITTANPNNSENDTIGEIPE